MRRSPEREMLVLAAREPSPQRDHALAAAVAAVADWRAVPALAHAHGLAPLLVRALKAGGAEARVPLRHAGAAERPWGRAARSRCIMWPRAGYPVRIAVGVRRVPTSRGVTGNSLLKLDGVPFHEPGAHPERTFVVMHRLPTA